MVSIVLALSVLVLMVVSDVVLEPITTTMGTVRQLRLPLKLKRRMADDSRSPPSLPCCCWPRDGCDCDVSPVSHALLPKLPHLLVDSRLLEHPFGREQGHRGAQVILAVAARRSSSSWLPNSQLVHPPVSLCLIIPGKKPGNLALISTRRGCCRGTCGKSSFTLLMYLILTHLHHSTT